MGCVHTGQRGRWLAVQDRCYETGCVGGQGEGRWGGGGTAGRLCRIDDILQECVYTGQKENERERERERDAGMLCNFVVCVGGERVKERRGGGWEGREQAADLLCKTGGVYH